MQAVTYDDYRGGQGYFKFEDMWLLVSEVYDMPTLERTIGSIDNVAAIVPVTIDAKSTESLLKVCKQMWKHTERFHCILKVLFSL